MVKQCVALMLCLSSYSIQSHAQNRFTDTAFYQALLQNMITTYTTNLGENTRLYNGTEYIEAHPGVSGSPFFQSDSLQAGTIFYDGVLYPNTPIAYDIAREEVIIKNHQNISIKLLAEKIGFFYLSNHLFVRIEEDTTQDNNIKTGFYDRIYKDKLTVLASRKKASVRVLQPADHYEFKEMDIYYIKKGGTYYPVNDKRSLLAVLQDKKEAIKEYFRKNNFNFKRDLEKTLVSTAGYYDQLNK